MGESTEKRNAETWPEHVGGHQVYRKKANRDRRRRKNSNTQLQVACRCQQEAKSRMKPRGNKWPGGGCGQEQFPSESRPLGVCRQKSMVSAADRDAVIGVQPALLSSRYLEVQSTCTSRRRGTSTGQSVTLPARSSRDGSDAAFTRPDRTRLGQWKAPIGNLALPTVPW